MNLTAIANEAGILTDGDFPGELAALLDPAFGIDTIYIAAHGWQTDLASFCVDQNRYMGGLYPAVVAASPAGQRARSLTIGLHWPSTLSQDSENPLRCFNAFTYYSCEHRADTVGANAGYALLSTIIRLAQRPIRFILLGHSFGAKVVSSALATLAQRGPAPAAGSVFDLILLQAAFQNNDLEQGGDYGALSSLPVRILATYSSEDRALNVFFKLATAANLLNPNHDRDALGAIGPTELTLKQLGPRILPLDLSGWHKEMNAAAADPMSGAHSAIYFPNLYHALGAAIAAPPADFPY